MTYKGSNSTLIVKEEKALSKSQNTLAVEVFNKTNFLIPRDEPVPLQ